MSFNNNLGHMGMEVPEHTQETLANYLMRGWAPGGFCESMLAMDMERALYTADIANRQVMWVIGRWILETCPTGSWGSYEAVNHWINDTDGRRSRYVNREEKKEIWNLLKEGA